MTKQNETSVAIVGGGVIGLAIAWRLALNKCAVTVFERDHVGRAASWAAAGMLAPVSECGFDHDDFLALALESQAAYPDFLGELKRDSGQEVFLDQRGALTVAMNRDDAENNRRLFNFREGLGLPVQWLSGSEAREIEPLLSPRVNSAMWIPDDWQVDNRSLVRALHAACVQCGVDVRENTSVTSLLTSGESVCGVQTSEHEHDAEVTIITAGCWSNQLGGIARELLPGVRPVKGQIVSLRMDNYCRPAHVIRAPDAYMVPKHDGRLLIGASQEEMGFDQQATAGTVMRLLEHAWEALPALYDLPLDGIDVGLRPGTRDHLPIIGNGGVPGLVIATGHFRHGILLAPATANIVATGITTGKFPASATAFSPARFHSPEHRDGTQG